MRFFVFIKNSLSVFYSLILFFNLKSTLLMELEALCHQVRLLTDEVRQFIISEFKSFDRKHIEYKGLNDMVSYVDKQAEKQLVERLSQLLPNSGFIAEEGTGNKLHKGYNWIIDPLDGTTNFIHGVPIFSISIALTHNDELLLGVVHELNQNEQFYAVKDKGAFCNGKPINVSAEAQLSRALVATGFPYHAFDKLPRYLEGLGEFFKKSHGLRRMGSAAVDLSYVACGRFDAFFEYNLHPWDVAAGTLIVREAGGKASTFSGGEDCVFGREMIAGGAVHEEVRKLVAQIFHA